MARRIVAVAPARQTPLAPLPCPFVHAVKGARPRCEACGRLYTAAEIAEFEDACNGDARCSLGRHVARVCEACASVED